MMRRTIVAASLFCAMVVVFTGLSATIIWADDNWELVTPGCFDTNPATPCSSVQPDDCPAGQTGCNGHIYVTQPVNVTTLTGGNPGHEDAYKQRVICFERGGCWWDTSVYQCKKKATAGDPDYDAEHDWNWSTGLKACPAS